MCHPSPIETWERSAISIDFINFTFQLTANPEQCLILKKPNVRIVKRVIIKTNLNKPFAWSALKAHQLRQKVPNLEVNVYYGTNFQKSTKLISIYCHFKMFDISSGLINDNNEWWKWMKVHWTCFQDHLAISSYIIHSTVVIFVSWKMYQ